MNLSVFSEVDHRTKKWPTILKADVTTHDFQFFPERARPIFKELKEKFFWLMAQSSFIGDY
jgi:hypothetical protein